MYTSKKFSTRSFDDISKDIEWAAKKWPKTEKVFLADGDALVLSTNKIIPILELIIEKFPNLKRITSYATPQNLLKKTPEELKAINQAGLKMLYYGVESGDDVILKKINKGASSDEILQGILKAHEAGFTISTTNLLGIAGKKYSEQHAVNTAKLLSKSNPKYVSFLMIMFPLGEERFIKAFGDDYEPLSQMDHIQELKTVLSHLNVKDDEVRANHASNYLPIKAHFPRDKDETLEMIDTILAKQDPSLLRPEFMRGL